MLVNFNPLMSDGSKKVTHNQALEGYQLTIRDRREISIPMLSEFKRIN